jgi:putative hydrolase of the HAD superfamily
LELGGVVERLKSQIQNSKSRLLAQTLLVDADDTLWANNIYFERAIVSFISFLNHHEYSPAQVRAVLDEVERECIIKHGYGLHSFAHALADTFERLAVDPVTPAIHEVIHGFAQEIAKHPLEIFDGVPETLAYLSRRHQLILMTKGDHREQSGKVERSGLGSHFRAVEIVCEKNQRSYQTVVAKHGLRKDQCWMIGNSPVSDINPALAIGLNAVFVPNAMTWVLENDEVRCDGALGRLLVLERFSDLQQHF